MVTVGHLVLLHQSTLPPAPNSQVTGAAGGSGAGRISGVISVSGVLVQPTTGVFAVLSIVQEVLKQMKVRFQVKHSQQEEGK